MDEERRIICSIVHSEVETLKDTFDDAFSLFYTKYDCRVSLRREKVVKYLSLLNLLIEDVKKKCEEIINE